MSRKFLDSLLEDMEYMNYQRWFSNQSLTNFGVPEYRNNTYINHYDTFNRGCYLPPYTLVPNTSKRNREAYYLVKRNEERNYSNGYYTGNTYYRGSAFKSNRKYEESRRNMSFRSSSFDLLPQNSRRQCSNWIDASSEQPRDNRDESFLRRQSRGLNRDRSAETLTSRSDHLKSKFEYVDSDDLMQNGNPCFHQTLNNNRVSNHHMDNSKIYNKNSSNSQLNMNTATLPSPNLVTEYASWYCAEEQQQIVNMLRDVNYRHERQLRRDILTAKTEQMSLDDSSSSYLDPNSSGSQHHSYSSDEEDGITVLVSPGDHPVIDTDIIPLAVCSDDLIEKSTSDYFEEFQNIFTTSPEKNIINTLVKECFKEQTGKIASQEKPASSECNALLTKNEIIVKDQFNNNVIKVEDDTTSDLSASNHSQKDESNGRPQSNFAEVANVKPYLYQDVCEKIRPLSTTRQLPRCFEPGIDQTRDLSASSNKVTSPAIEKDAMAAVELSRSSGISEKDVGPRCGSVTEMKQMSIPSKFRVYSSTDQIPLTDQHRRRIQKQKYDFDCKFNKTYDPKMYFKPPSQSSISAASSWKPLQHYISTKPSGKSLEDLGHLFYNHQRILYENVKKVACIPIQTAQNQMPRELHNRTFYKVPYHKNIQRSDSSARTTRISFPTSCMPDIGNMVQSDPCLLKNLRLPQEVCQKASMSESNLQIKSSKDLDKIYKRISLEELFSSDKDIKPIELEVKLDIPCSSVRLGGKCDPTPSSFVSPSNHLKQILNIGSNDAFTSIAASQKNERAEFKEIMPFRTDTIKTRISTACQTESCIETVEKSKSQFKVTIENKKSVCKDGSFVNDCDTKKISNPKLSIGIRMQNNSEDISKLKNKAEVLDENISGTRKPDDTIQLSKDTEKGLKKGSRKKGKSKSNKLKGDSISFKEICCEKCLQNTDIMSFSENKQHPDIAKPITIENELKSRSRMNWSDEQIEFLDHGITTEKANEMAEKKYETSSSGSKTARNTQTKADSAKSNSRNKNAKSKNIYIDVFKELSKDVDNSTFSSNDCAVRDVVNEIGIASKSPIFDSKSNGSINQDGVVQESISEELHVHEGVRTKSYKSWRSNKFSFGCTECNQEFKSNRYDSGRFKEHRYRKQFKRSERPIVFNVDSNDEHAFKTSPVIEKSENATKELIDSSIGSLPEKEMDPVHRLRDVTHIDNPISYHPVNIIKNNKDDCRKEGLVSDDVKLQNLDLSRHQREVKNQSEFCLDISSNKRSDEGQLNDQNNYEVTDSALCTSSKSQESHLSMKIAYICEESVDDNSKGCNFRQKERYIHNVNAPIPDVKDFSTTEQNAEKNESEIDKRYSELSIENNLTF